MPSQALWSTHKALIQDLYYDKKVPLPIVRATLTAERAFTTSLRSYERQFQLWNTQNPERPRKKYCQFYEDSHFLSLVEIFWHRNYSPSSMLRVLRDEFGYKTLTSWALKQVRRRFTFPARGGRDDEQDREEHLYQSAQFVLKTLRSGLSGRWGSTYTQSWVRQHTKVWIHSF